MKLLNKIFELEAQEHIKAEDIENYIKSKGYEPIRWAIVKANNKTLIIESTIIQSEI